MSTFRLGSDCHGERVNHVERRVHVAEIVEAVVLFQVSQAARAPLMNEHAPDLPVEILWDRNGYDVACAEFWAALSPPIIPKKPFTRTQWPSHAVMLA